MEAVRWSIAWILILWGLALPQGGWSSILPADSEPVPAPHQSRTSPAPVTPLSRSIAPSWGGQASFLGYAQTDNEGLLGRSDFRGLNLLPRELLYTPFSEQRSAELRQHYDDLTRDYLQRERFGLLDTQTRAAHQAKLRQLSENVWGEIVNQQVQQQRTRLVRTSPVTELERLRKKIPVPLQFIAILAASMYFGQPMTWEVAPATRVHGMVDLPRQRSSFGLSSQIIDTKIDVRGMPEGSIDPNAPTPAEFPAKSFRYQMTVSRPIPLIDVVTGVSYVSTTESVSASLSKQIIPNLTASVDTTQPLNPKNRLQPREEAVRLQYGINF